MQPAFEKVQLRPDESFRCLEFGSPRFGAPWHQHPELELTLILHSSGLRFVGDRIESFQSGDLVLVGANLPHCWLNERTPPRPGAHAIVIQFGETFLGHEFLRAPEMRGVHKLLERAARGLCFAGRARAHASERLRELPRLRGGQRLLSLLAILELLAATREVRPLSSASFRPSFDPTASERIDRVHRFLLEHLTEEIDLGDVAALAHLSPAAFCRYFKRTTGKPLFSMLNEMRIGHACRLLLEESRSISEVCYASGYGNLSHFNRQFQRTVGYTPTEYRRRIAEAAGPARTVKAH